MISWELSQNTQIGERLLVLNRTCLQGLGKRRFGLKEIRQSLLLGSRGAKDVIQHVTRHALKTHIVKGSIGKTRTLCKSYKLGHWVGKTETDKEGRLENRTKINASFYQINELKCFFNKSATNGTFTSKGTVRLPVINNRMCPGTVVTGERGWFQSLSPTTACGFGILSKAAYLPQLNVS